MTVQIFPGWWEEIRVPWGREPTQTGGEQAVQLHGGDGANHCTPLPHPSPEGVAPGVPWAFP